MGMSPSPHSVLPYSTNNTTMRTVNLIIIGFAIILIHAHDFPEVSKESARLKGSSASANRDYKKGLFSELQQEVTPLDEPSHLREEESHPPPHEEEAHEAERSQLHEEYDVVPPMQTMKKQLRAQDHQALTDNWLDQTWSDDFAVDKTWSEFSHSYSDL